MEADLIAALDGLFTPLRILLWVILWPFYLIYAGLLLIGGSQLEGA